MSTKSFLANIVIEKAINSAEATEVLSLANNLFAKGLLEEETVVEVKRILGVTNTEAVEE